jgi:hypothetical protein
MRSWRQLRRAPPDSDRTPREDGESPRWARFYDLKSQKPIFTGKTDGRTYPTYEAMRQRSAST